MPDHGLHAEQLNIIRSVLAPYADRIERVGIFGSRATGRARPDSDIDLVLYGAIDEALQNRLWTLFDESPLAIKVDVQAYNLITHPPLKVHIDTVMRVLFSQEALRT